MYEDFANRETGFSLEGGHLEDWLVTGQERSGRRGGWIGSGRMRRIHVCLLS